MAKCAFGKVSLRGTFNEYWQLGTELYARLFYVDSNGTEVLIAALDLADSFRKTAVRFREKLSYTTGIPADNIWYHELQIHAAPGSAVLTDEVADAMAERVAIEVNNMKSRAATFECEVTEAYAGTEFSYNREQYVHGLGGVTVWAGLDYDKDGKPYTQNSERMLLRGYKPRISVLDKPVYFDNPNDPLAYLFVFKDESGKTIGTLSRFAAHPDIAVLFESHGANDYHFDFDWTGYLCEYMESEFGAPAVYLNGPCANLAMKKGFEGLDTYEKSAREAKRVGEHFGNFLMKSRKKKCVPFGDADNCKAARFEFELPINDDFPNSVAELLSCRESDEAAAEEALQNAIANGAPASEVKKLIDDRYRAGYRSLYCHCFCCFGDEELSRRTATVDFTALRLGNYLFAGVAGESMVEMSYWLRSSFTGVKTVPIDQVNGYYGYMATPASLTLGGYTYWNSWVSRDAIPRYKEEIIKAMDGFLD